MTFIWFKQAYDWIITIIEMIKSSAIHRRVAARLKAVKEWLKTGYSGPGYLFKSFSKSSKV